MLKLPDRGQRRDRVVRAALVGLVVVGLAVCAMVASAGTRATAAAPRATTADAVRGEITSFLHQHGRAEHFSAIALRVTRPGSSPISVQAGTTRWHGGRPLAAQAVWQIGSNTKAFTSVALLKLEAAGKLSIDDRIGRWLPQYPAWRHVTIRQLLSMTSGIPDFTGTRAFLHTLNAHPDQRFTAAQDLSYVKHLPLGPKTWAYSNTDYVLAQLIIAQVSRESYFRYVQTRVIAPLGLHHTCFAPETCRARIASEMPAGYSELSKLPGLLGKPLPKLNVTDAQGAGGLVSSLPDLLKWERALYDGHILPAAQQRQLTTLVSERTGRQIGSVTPADPTGFGLGLTRMILPGIGSVWMYPGATYGYLVGHIFDPRTGLALAIAVNSDDQTNNGANGQAALLTGLAGQLYATLEDTTAPTAATS
jgi:D-alanyl-D-alanine carboxypeptidase